MMNTTLSHEKWDGLDCPICKRDCWDDRIKLAVEIAKTLDSPFNMRNLYNKLAEQHPPARWCERRQTPWNTFFRDLYNNPFFEKVGRGMFRLRERPIMTSAASKTEKTNDLTGFEISVKKLMLLKEAKLISEEDYAKKGKELLESIKTTDVLEKETGLMRENVVECTEKSTKRHTIKSEDGFPPREVTEEAIIQILLETGGSREIRTSRWNIYDELAERLGVSVEAREQLTKKTREPKWRPEVGFARKNLEQRGIILSTKISGRGVWTLSNEFLRKHSLGCGVKNKDGA